MKKTILIVALAFIGWSFTNAQAVTTKADGKGITTVASAHDGADHHDGAACCKGKGTKCEHDKGNCSKECKKDAKKKAAKADCCKGKGAACCKNGGSDCCKKDVASAAACCKKGEGTCKGHTDAGHQHPN